MLHITMFVHKIFTMEYHSDIKSEKFWHRLLYCLSHQGLWEVPPSSPVAQSCPTLCNPLDCSTPGFPVLHQLPELTQIHVHRVTNAIQPPHPLSSSSPPAFNLSQHQGHFKWVSSSHQVAKVLEFQLQHQSFQWTFRADFLSDELVGIPCRPRGA